jgi:hypothetical protein
MAHGLVRRAGIAMRRDEVITFMDEGFAARRQFPLLG